MAAMVRPGSCTDPAGESPARVSVGAPGSRHQPGREIVRAERCEESLRYGGSEGAGRNRVNAVEASSEHSVLGPDRALGLPGVEATARVGRVGAGGKREGMAVRPNTPTDKVRELQRRLYVAAKRSSTRRFHALYDRICRGDVLREAWKAMARVRERVHDLTDARRSGAKDVQEIIASVNPVIRGWANYFRTGTADREFNRIDGYVHERITRWLWRRGGQRARHRWTQWPFERLFAMGLHRLKGRVRYPAQATPRRPSASRVRATRTHGLKGGPGTRLA
jgi:hypothetical protein